MDERLAGGMDEGAALVDGTVRRRQARWSATVQDLLSHLEKRGLDGVPRFVGIDDQAREMVTFLSGETVGDQRPWPAWTHSETALTDVGSWLARYHRAVADYLPPAGAIWQRAGPGNQG